MSLLCDGLGQDGYVLLLGALRRYMQVEKGICKPFSILYRGCSSLNCDHRCKSHTLYHTSQLNSQKYHAAGLLTEVIPWGIPYAAPSLCPNACDRPSALPTHSDTSETESKLPPHSHVSRRFDRPKTHPSRDLQFLTDFDVLWVCLGLWEVFEEICDRGVE